jgi:hypothetical protein
MFVSVGWLAVKVCQRGGGGRRKTYERFFPLLTGFVSHLI